MDNNLDRFNPVFIGSDGKGGTLRGSIDQFFEHRQTIRENPERAASFGEVLQADGDRNLVMGIPVPDEFPGEWRSTGSLGTDSGALLGAKPLAGWGLDGLSLAKSRPRSATRWVDGMDDLNLFRPRSRFNPSTWQQGGPYYNRFAAVAAGSQVVVMYDGSFVDTWIWANPADEVRVDYVWVVVKGTPIGEPNLGKQLNQPGYRFPVA